VLSLLLVEGFRRRRSLSGLSDVWALLRTCLTSCFLRPHRPTGFSLMSKKRKRVSRRRLAGQRVLAHVTTHNIETGEYKPVTAARRFIAESAIFPPALVNVRRNEHTTDRFFWGEKGLFSAQYAEENHFLFPSLREIVDRIGEDNLFAGLEALAADDWEEMEEYEYAFV